MQRYILDCLPMPSPPATRSLEDIHPALSSSNTTVPVTPGVDLAGGSSYVHSPESLSTRTSQPQWNSNSYFAPDATTIAPDSPTRAAAGSRSSGELLRRLSLIDGVRPHISLADPCLTYPSLNLSGGIISATFCMPHTLGFETGHDWVSIHALESVFEC